MKLDLYRAILFYFMGWCVMLNDNLQPVFTLDKIYIKDASIEVPNAPKIFTNRNQPNVEFNMSYSTLEIDNGVYETTLHARINAKINHEQMFLIEIDQAAIFQIKNVSVEQIEILHNVECPSYIFPYLRESVSDLTIKAGFAPVVLAPINFNYLYQQKKETQSHPNVTNTLSQNVTNNPINNTIN